MKKIIRILLFTLLFLLTAVIVLPFIFKGKIIRLAKEEINRNINATVEFGDVSLNLFRSFPHLSLGITDLSVVNKTPFYGDTLFVSEKLRVTIDIMSAFRGSPYEVRKLAMERPTINLKVLEDGTANWDIALDTEENREDSLAGPDKDAFTVQMKKLSITEGRFRYDNLSIPFVMTMEGVEHTLSGDLSASSTRLETNTSAENLVMTYNGVTYLSGVKASVASGFDADLDNFIFTFRDGELKVNDLLILASGLFGMPEEGYDMDFAFNAPGSEFSQVLSLIPAIYAKDFAKVKTSGSFILSGMVKGRYSDTEMPAFNLDLGIENGYFKYPDLPSAVEEISLTCTINNPDGQMDNTIIDMPKLHLLMAGAPVDASLYLTTPVSDPNIKANVKAKLDLSTVQAFYPLEETDLDGKIDADVKLAGRMSSIDNGRYDEFKAEGQLLVSKLKYVTTGQPALSIPAATINFSPERLSIARFNMQAGRTNLAAEGYLTNYMAFFLRDEMLLGRFTVAAGTIDVNEFMDGDETDPGSPAVKDTGSMKVVHIPGNIDFSMNTTAKKILFGDMVLEDVKGEVRVANSTLTLDGFTMNTLDGSITANGTYRAPVGKRPYLDMIINTEEISIVKAYEATGMMRRLAPVAKHTRGNITTGLRLEGFLDEKMMPVFTTLNGGGNLATSSLVISGLPALAKIGEILSIKELQDAVLDKVKASFEFKDGRVHVKPFTIKSSNVKGLVSGSTGFDQTLEYTMNLEVPRALMGSSANGLINSWTEQANKKGLDIKVGDMIKVAVLIGGTVTDPKITTGFADMAATLKDELMNVVEDKVKEVREQVSAKADQLLDEAQLQADKIISEAEKAAGQVRSAAYQAAARVRQEGDTQAKKIIVEGKSRGPIAAVLADKTASSLRKEADANAQKLEKEGDNKADLLINEARKQADQTISAARKKAEEI